jgi:hypothetical protein
MAKDVDATRVGGDHPADRGRVASAEVHADIPAGEARGLLHTRQRGASADRDLAGTWIDLGDSVQTEEAEHDLTTTRH